MLSPVGLTSRWVAAARALESERSDRLFLDPYARFLAGDEGFAIMEQTKANIPGGNVDVFLASLAIRTRYFDDGIRAAIARGTRQLVILAAGMDARAFRMEFPVGFKTWELDRQEIFDVKQKTLEPLRPKTGCTRYAIPVDLRDDWPDALLAADFKPSEPAAFLIEGLLVYLAEEDVNTLLDRIGKVAAKGSWLGTDIVGTSLLKSDLMASMHTFMNKLGAPWGFSTDDPESLLEKHCWTPHCSCVGDPDANYGRWPFPPMPRDMPGVPRSYYCSSVRG